MKQVTFCGAYNFLLSFFFLMMLLKSLRELERKALLVNDSNLLAHRFLDPNNALEIFLFPSFIYR